ncbi:dihydroorotate dehydrogenase electron transfer subunit [Chloroflexota bacterium]
MKQVINQILSKSEVAPGVYILWIKAPEIAGLAHPGQFVMVRCGKGYDPLLRRPLAIHQVVKQKERLAILFAVVGLGTSWLAQRKAGETIDLFGPLGKGFKVHPPSKKLLLVAGGIGIAPIISLAESAIADGYEVTLLTGNKKKAFVYPQKFLPNNLKRVIVTDDGSLGKKGLITDLLPEFIHGSDQIFACGPLPMYQTMANMTEKFDDKPVQVLLETMMGCGVGACLGCTIRTKQGQKQVCKDGPVFELREVIWKDIPQLKS